MKTEKLIRHRLPDQIRARGEKCETRIAKPGEMLGFLRDKLVEEVEELCEARQRAVARRLCPSCGVVQLHDARVRRLQRDGGTPILKRDDVDAVIDRLGLRAMFEHAEKEGLWFWCRYADLWFSPDQLRKAISEKTFRWGAVNWALRDPQEQVARLREAEAAAKRECEAFEATLKAQP